MRLYRVSLPDTFFVVIVSFRLKELEAFYLTGSVKGIQPAHARKLAMILALLAAARGPEDLAHPPLRLHPPKGALAGQWSVWVNGNWRVSFRFTGSDVELVDYQDYH